MNRLLDNQRFDMGMLVSTRAVGRMRRDNREFDKFVVESLFRFAREDWGTVSEGDGKLNDLSVQEEIGGGASSRLMGAYVSPGLPKIWIITEADRSVTTVLFPEEYRRRARLHYWSILAL